MRGRRVSPRDAAVVARPSCVMSDLSNLPGLTARRPAFPDDVSGRDLHLLVMRGITDRDPGLELKQVVVAVDWDGTLVDADGRWLPGAVDALVRLVRGGDKVVIHSCRAGWAAGADEIRSRLAEVGLVGRVELAVGGKPAADAYVDDKAVRFSGDWADTLWRLKHESRSSRPSTPTRTGR